MTNVVRLTKREPDVWQCLCGSHRFWLYSDGTATCSMCEHDAREMAGVWPIPEANRGQSAEIVAVVGHNCESISGD